jgi:hypothetical protein
MPRGLGLWGHYGAHFLALVTDPLTGLGRGSPHGEQARNRGHAADGLRWAVFGCWLGHAYSQR